jgi:branched-chain amino acid aminotransferase
MGPSIKAKERGYTVLLFLDPREHKYVEEFATSNFVALTKADEDGKRTYITPISKSILTSVTNRSLSELAAKYFKWNVERRRISWEEVKNGTFDEIAACGTAVVITPINRIDRELVETENDEFYKPNTDINTMWDEKPDSPAIKIEKVQLSSSFQGFKMLYEMYRGIQNGEQEDIFGWMYPVEGISRK